MFTLTNALILVALVVMVLAVINRRALANMLGLANAQVSKVGRWAENQDPVGQMQHQADQAKEQLKQAKAALVKCEALKTDLDRQVTNDTREEARLTARVKTARGEGRTDEDPIMINYGKQLVAVRARLAQNKGQLELQVGVYNDLLNQVQTHVGNIEALERDAANLGVQLETSEANAELGDLLAQFQPGAINSAIGRASRFKEAAQKKIAENNARLKVNRDLGATGTAGVQDYEDTADAKAALADIK